jgi:hypothetical protein
VSPEEGDLWLRVCTVGKPEDLRALNRGSAGVPPKPLRETVITSVDGVPVETHGDLMNITDSLRGREVLIEFEGGRHAFAKVDDRGRIREIEFVGRHEHGRTSGPPRPWIRVGDSGLTERDVGDVIPPSSPPFDRGSSGSNAASIAVVLTKRLGQPPPGSQSSKALIAHVKSAKSMSRVERDDQIPPSAPPVARRM